jgi:hypothetical protein
LTVDRGAVLNQPSDHCRVAALYRVNQTRISGYMRISGGETRGGGEQGRRYLGDRIRHQDSG